MTAITSSRATPMLRVVRRLSVAPHEAALYDKLDPALYSPWQRDGTLSSSVDPRHNCKYQLSVSLYSFEFGVGCSRCASSGNSAGRSWRPVLAGAGKGGGRRNRVPLFEIVSRRLCGGSLRRLCLCLCMWQRDAGCIVLSAAVTNRTTV